MYVSVRALTALVVSGVLMTVAIAVAAQADRSEIAAPWDESATVTIIDTGLTEIAGMPDEDFCRTMAWLLLQYDSGHVPDDAAIDFCASSIGGTLAGQAWVPETWLPLLFEGHPTGTVEAGDSIRISGTGGMSTEPFTLAAGDYQVTLRKSSACDQATYGYLISTESGASVSGEISRDGYIHGVDTGTYYWSAEGADQCRWTYTLTPST